jgi:ABC-type polysaccharide/polyol phosphate export permease
VVWNYFTAVTTQGCNCFLVAEAYIRQYPTPLAIFPLRTALGGMIHLLLALGVVLAVAACTTGLPHPLVMLSLIPGLLLLFALVWSTTLLAGCANVLFRDTEHLVPVAFQIFFYATPIIYRADMLTDYQLDWLMRYHPLAAFLALVRDPIYARQIPDDTTYITASATVMVMAGIAALVLKRLQRKMIFYL